MKKLFGIVLMFCLLGMTLSANKLNNNGYCEYYDRDTLDYDTLVVVEEVVVDTLWDEDYILCDTIMEDEVIVRETTEDIRRFSPLGESSAGLYARKQFKMKNPDGSEFKYQVNDDGVSVTLMSGTANGTSKLIIPSSVEGLGSYFFVVEIDQFAFRNFLIDDNCPMKGVKQLVISDGIVSIGQNAFDKSPDLEFVSLPSSLEIIPYSMFYDCPNLREVQISDDSHIKEIESLAFAGCSSLESFLIPSEVTKIGEGPWRGCTALQRLTLQDGNYNFVVEDGVLYTGWQGDLIQYPAGKRDKFYSILYGTKAICNSAFYGNPYIETVSIPASVESISHAAFFDCASLKNVSFHNEIQFIGNLAFAECPNLKQITLYGSPQYTNEPGDLYNTFSEWTSVTIENNIPPIKLPKSSTGILSSAWDYVSQMPYFYREEIKNNEDFGFPQFIGKGKAAVSGNAGPKPDVLHVLEAIPSAYLIFENNDERNRTTRFYLDKSDKKNPRVLYFFGGIGGNDLVVVLFEGGNLKQIEKMIDNLMQEKYGK